MTRHEQNYRLNFEHTYGESKLNHTSSTRYMDGPLNEENPPAPAPLTECGQNMMRCLEVVPQYVPKGEDGEA